MEKSQCPGGDYVHNKCPGLDNIKCCKSVCVEEELVDETEEEGETEVTKIVQVCTNSFVKHLFQQQLIFKTRRNKMFQ